MIIKWIERFTLWMCFIGIAAFIFDLGFFKNDLLQYRIQLFYFVILSSTIISTIARYLNRSRTVRWKVLLFDLLFIAYVFWIFSDAFLTNTSLQSTPLFSNHLALKIAILITFIREFSEVNINFKRTVLNPAQLLLISFILIILIGTFFLMLPKSTHEGISFVNALFTSTSAVCVTGLAVVDTGTYFTEFGQLIIMCLIQIGGLGILTFTSYFSYFFKHGATFENQLVLSDMVQSKKMGEVFLLLKQIIQITLFVELFSAGFIYFSLKELHFEGIYDRIFFASFHAISAFCNAGFSTLSNSLYEDGFRFNYMLQLIIIITFVFGGLGFPIVSNIIRYIKYRLKKLFTFNQKIDYKPWVLSLNSRITLITTISITLVAFITFYFLEYNNTLATHHGFGKVVTALFGATTPRTAGFNTIDTASLLLPTIMVTILLMWIGASPTSTGGGIKTSTFAIATLNILSIAKGKTRIEIFRREISDISVRRSFAIISTSLIIIGMGVLLIAIFDSDKNLLHIAFECFSAYSTVGLSLGITAGLSAMSKFILVAVMLAGRVGMLTIIIAIFRKVLHKNYRYPTEDIIIT